MQPFELLDRFELMYPNNSKLSDLRRAYIDKDLSSIFRLLPEEHEDLRKAVIEQNLHSIFRLLPAEHEDSRKALNLEDLRKAVIEQNLHSIFRLLPEEHEELGRAVIEQNLHSIFRLVDDEELRKLLLEDNIWKLWPVLSRYTDTQFVEAFKNFFVNDTEIWDDCFARGQLESKLWLVRELQQCNIPLGTVFICAGWYATIATMLFESDMEIDKIRSFDIDTTCAEIAEVFNKPWVVDGWKFKAAYKDIHDIDFTGKTPYSVYKSNGEEQLLCDSPDTVINTSCEHIENFEEWYANIPDGKLVILQSNNFYEVDEHVNCVADVDEFIDTAPMTTVLYSGELELPKYTRFMIIGYK